jgi:hypothetical protein
MESDKAHPFILHPLDNPVNDVVPDLAVSDMSPPNQNIAPLQFLGRQTLLWVIQTHCFRSDIGVFVQESGNNAIVTFWVVLFWLSSLRPSEDINGLLAPLLGNA